ncbi:MAG TPA: class I SAM-dependent methyltransferase [Thermoanaerobaculia bacterium]|nr:class I SAM-dependent methyltransferase [Thermoanaerobaculia bacterium]
MTLEEWNERYRSREDIDADPAELLVTAAGYLPPGRALDLACGAGRNARWLASRGWEVVAMDGSSEAIRIVNEHEGNIDARVMDFERNAALPFDDESFDLVAILYYLHRPLFAEAKRVVKRGGVIVCAVKMIGTYRVKSGELAQHFEGFGVLRSNEGEIAELVARRPYFIHSNTR